MNSFVKHNKPGMKKMLMDAIKYTIGEFLTVHEKAFTDIEAAPASFNVAQGEKNRAFSRKVIGILFWVNCNMWIIYISLLKKILSQLHWLQSKPKCHLIWKQNILICPPKWISLPIAYFFKNKYVRGSKGHIAIYTYIRFCIFLA